MMLTEEQKTQIGTFARGCWFDRSHDDLIVEYAGEWDGTRPQSVLADDEKQLILARGFWFDTLDGDTAPAKYCEIFSVNRYEVFATGKAPDMAILIKLADAYIQSLRPTP